jgi:SAM-dependent methyltransferase
MAFETVTDDQWAMYSAILEKAMQSRRRKILDFGCGPGRFTSLLTGYANEVIGVDVCKALLHLAPTSERVKYIQILPSCLPFSAGHFDMVWINLVLGGIVDDLSLRSTAAEIERVLSPGGLLFLAENTTRGDAQPYWKFRSRSEYTRLFPSSQLEIATTYTDVNEEITVLVGHKLT